MAANNFNSMLFQVQQLYHEREAEMEERMRDVSRRARTPSVVAKVRTFMRGRFRGKEGSRCR